MRLLFPLIAVGFLAACSDAEPVEPSVDEDAPAEGVESVGGEVAQFGNGVQLVESKGTVEETVARLEEALDANGFMLVSKVAHHSNAQDAELDLELRPVVTLVFGKPEVGSHLMAAAPGSALDLPQKMAVYEDAEGKVMLAYNSPVWLASRHNIEGQDDRLEAMATMLETLAMRAAGNDTSEDPAAPDGPGDAPLMMDEEDTN